MAPSMAAKILAVQIGPKPPHSSISCTPSATMLCATAMPCSGLLTPTAIMVNAGDTRSILQDMARLLLIDDDPSLLDVLCMAMEDAGHVCLRAADGREGLRLIRGEQPQLVVSDVNMPQLDGFALCRTLRAEGNDVPLILLTSRDSEVDEALGLDLGADDYVTKPFSTRVVLARVLALLRRRELAAQPAQRSLKNVGKLSLDAERLELRVSGQLVRTTVTEFRVLATLAEHPGIVYSRERIMERVRGDDSVVAPRIIDTYVRALRRKLEALDPPLDPIETVVGAGYRLRDTF